MRPQGRDCALGLRFRQIGLCVLGCRSDPAGGRQKRRGAAPAAAGDDGRAASRPNAAPSGSPPREPSPRPGTSAPAEVTRGSGDGSRDAPGQERPAAAALDLAAALLEFTSDGRRLYAAIPVPVPQKPDEYQTYVFSWGVGLDGGGQLAVSPQWKEPAKAGFRVRACRAAQREPRGLRRRWRRGGPHALGRRRIEALGHGQAGSIGVGPGRARAGGSTAEAR